jgi:single-strand DNA-binding protein
MTTYSMTGLVATTPRHLITQEGLPITSFRLASSKRHFDEEKQVWIESETNWFTITAFRTLAINVAKSVSKGDRITVSGTIRVRDWDNGERSGTSVEVEADSLGHDLNYGTSEFNRTQIAPPTTTPVKPQHKCNCGGCDRSNN